MFRILRPCIEHLGFDDRRLMLIGIPLMSLLFPVLLDLNAGAEKELGFFTHQVPESMIFVTGFWFCYRWLIIGLRKKYGPTEDINRRITKLVLVVLVSAPILKQVFEFVAFVLLAICDIHDHAMPDPLRLMVSIYLPSFLILAIYEAAYYAAHYKQAIIDRQRIETQHVNIELSNLRNQINPHFLFNSLNTLMNLIPTDQERAMNYLSKLSKFYRYAVGVKEEKLIPLSKEIEFANLFVDLLHERFRDALDVKIIVDNEQGHMIPPLSLQLLIENAVKHNVVSKDAPLSIEIVLDAEEGEIVISNNIQRKLNSVESSGMGLSNIKERFKYFTSRPVKVVQNIELFQVALPTIMA